MQASRALRVTPDFCGDEHHSRRATGRHPCQESSCAAAGLRSVTTSENPRQRARPRCFGPDGRTDFQRALRRVASIARGGLGLSGGECGQYRSHARRARLCPTRVTLIRPVAPRASLRSRWPLQTSSCRPRQRSRPSPIRARAQLYTFLSSERVIGALSRAGFVPVSAAQTRTRTTNPLSARHAIRFRRRYESVTLRDCIPEILFINGHDGRTATQFRLGLFRPICTNGLIVCDDTLPAWRVPHRGNTLDEVIAAAIAQSEQFDEVGRWVARMEATRLEPEQRTAFAAQALELRFPKHRPHEMQTEHLLTPRRDADHGHDVWTTYNVVQEWVIRGGISYQTKTQRQMQSRSIRAIREDVRLNTGLWRLATALAS